MRAVIVEKPGDETALRLGEVSVPSLGPGELRLRVAAAGVNRADLMQRQGLYPPPPDASPVMGLECSGEVVEVGGDVSGWKLGDRAMALLAGGGYAEEVVVDAGCAMAVPSAWSWAEAAAFPEVQLTVHLNLFQLAGLEKGQRCLVHGGSSGIGTAAIAMARLAGAEIAVTAGSADKCKRCLELGANLAINYRDEDFVEAVRGWTEGRGLDALLDSIGAPYFDRNLACLKTEGQLVLIGLMGGAKAEMNLGLLLRNRITLHGSTLRARPVARKQELVRQFLAQFQTAMDSGELRPVVDRVLPVSRVADAHRAMQASEHIGKIVLSMEEFAS